MTRRSAAILITLTVISGVILFSISRDPPAPASPADFPTRIPPPPATPFPEELTRTPAAEQAQLLNDPAESPQEDLAIIDLLITDYRRHFAGNPVGENEEITAALAGKNPKGLIYLPPDSPAIDAQGQLTDRWGSPYFFHAIAADRMEITSPGPDRQLHTADDVTLQR